MDDVLIFDIETHSTDLLFTLPPEEFVRLIGYKWRDSNEVVLTTDLEELRARIRKARWVIGHNIHSFDLPATFGVNSDEPLQLAMEKRVYDTWTHAVLVNPAPPKYVNRKGKTALADTPEKMKSWYSLDEQAYQLGVQGKTHDLKALALEFGREALPDASRREQVNAGFGLIPVDDKRYRDYLVGDVLASEAVARALLDLGTLNHYAMREQEIEARKFVIRSNGCRVDIPKATARREDLAARKAVVLKELQEKYGLPTEGASPWAGTEGKAAIFKALATYGITPDTCEWPKTAAWHKRNVKIAEARAKADALDAQVQGWNKELQDSSLTPRSRAVRERWIERDLAKARDLRENPLPEYYGLSLGGTEIKELTQGTPAEAFGEALAELKGQRPLSQQALDSVHPDGFVHPEITMLQRSGRWSTTEPGLTTWTNSGPGAIEKDYFIPDNEDEVLIEFDYSNADARIIAAVSGDRKYAERFEPGADGHMINAIAAWGEEAVSKDPKGYRTKGKPLGHGWSYGAGPKGLQRATGVPLEDTETFCKGMSETFVVLVTWQNHVRQDARITGYAVNDWGRKMKVEKGREYTQAPALHGQSGTREIVCDALLRMTIEELRKVKAQVHDALVVSVPRDQEDYWRRRFTEVMETTFKPKRGGLELEFPVGSGPAGNSWYEAIH